MVDSEHDDAYHTRFKSEMRASGIEGPSGLAKALGFSYQAAKKFLEGGGLGLEKHFAAAALFGVRAEWLATGSGPRTETSASTTAAQAIHSLRAMLAGHSQSRRQTLGSMLDRLSQFPDDAELADEVILFLKPPAKKAA